MNCNDIESNTSMNTAAHIKAQPWWSYGMVWMVIAGPAIVVVAAFITLYLAITIPDPVLPTEAMNPRNAIDNQSKLEEAMAPAMQARNHAATGVAPLKK
jgi:heme/copper-type cytochrome/quinol oxidase subunit 2